MAKRPTQSSPQEAPEFAPSDPADGRKQYQWESKYPSEAKKQIYIEAVIVFSTLFLVPVLMLVVWTGWLSSWLGLDPVRSATFNRYCYAWLAGTLGGTLFNLKWLYHVVARGYWHLERRLWRLLTPHISGGHAFAIIVVMSSGILKIFDATELSRPPVIVAVGFLVGYFSDTAIGKLTEVAHTLFGTHNKGYDDRKVGNEGGVAD